MRGPLANLAVLLIGGATTAAQPIAPYIVTSSPIKMHVGSPGVCVAIDPLDPHGVWWWEPGASGCATRSTVVFHANDATVSRPGPGLTAVEFRLSIHSIERPHVTVRLILDGYRLRSAETGSEVGVEGRQDLTLPEEVPRGRRSVPQAVDSEREREGCVHVAVGLVARDQILRLEVPVLEAPGDLRRHLVLEADRDGGVLDA